jgi:tRNA G46 methylase TrmB
MITLNKFKDLDQEKPIQQLLDAGGYFEFSTDWYDVYIHPTKDNVLMQWDADTKVFHCRPLNEPQDLRNTPIRTILEIDQDYEKKVRRANDDRNLEINHDTEYLLKYSAIKVKAQTYHKD